MSPEFHLLVNNIGIIISGVASLGIAVFVYFSNRHRVANIAVALMMLSMATFAFSHVIGISISDPKLSRIILMFNISVIFIAVFNTHAVLSAINKTKERRLVLSLIYVVGFVMTAVFLIFPDTFLLDSVPKMYFPNYYVPGSLHWLFRLIFDISIPIYIVAELLWAYWLSREKTEKNRYLYFSIAEIAGWGMGFFPLPLIYNYNVDPALGSLCLFFFAIPFVYALVQYELFDIKVVAKKAFWYAIAIVAVGGLIMSLEIFNRWINIFYPRFPSFVAPLFSAVFIVIVGLLVWRKLREEDLLKYEFVTTASHKFRTPLTHIKWASENLLETELAPIQRTQLEDIKRTNNRLIELVNLLLSLTESKSDTHSYHFSRGDFTTVVQEVADSFRDQVVAKRLKFTSYFQPGLETVFDPARIKFVIEVLIENAVVYTPIGGSITVATRRDGGNFVFIIQDTGIGLTATEIPLIFSRFYRAADAKLADTEGMGIGLFLSREVLAKHNGKIWVHSEGLKLGTTVGISIPVVTSGAK